MVGFFQRPVGWGLVSVGPLRDLVGIQRRPGGCAFERQDFVASLCLQEMEAEGLSFREDLVGIYC